jgi:KipI family sensor histidine kinase inhibitor
VRVRPAGRHALLAEVDSLDELRRRDLPDVLDLVPAARTVLVVADPGRAGPQRLDLDQLAAELPGWELPPAADRTGAAVEVPVRYDGPDLDEVCRRTGLSRDEVVTRHTGADYLVAFCGFAPGFAYLAGLPPELHVPRRDDPRTAVPAGSVGLAGEFTGVYPRSSPGGWQLIGRTGLELWNPDRDPPALLAPGTAVRFVAAEAAGERP